MAESIKIKKTFFQILTEMLLIIFSVFLGLYLTNYFDEQKEIEKTNHALQAIADEITWNRNFLNGRVEYYKTLVEELDSMGVSRNNPDPKSPITKWRGLNPPLLRNAAYQTAMSSQLFANTDFKTGEQLSILYSFQEFYMSGVRKIMDNFLDDKVSNKLKVRSYISELAQVGSELVRTYDDVHAQLVKTHGVKLNSSEGMR